VLDQYFNDIEVVRVESEEGGWNMIKENLYNFAKIWALRYKHFGTVQKSLGPIIISSCKRIELLLISKATIAFPNIRVITTTRWATDTTHKCVTVAKHFWYYIHMCIKTSNRVQYINFRTPQRSLCCEIGNAHALVSFNTVYMHC